MAQHRADATRMLDDRGYSGHLIRGQPPHHLIEEGVRHRIVNSYYWKEQCFGLNAATLLDRCADITFIGGTYHDGQRPTPFLCLAFKMLQLGIDDDILLYYLREGGEEFKYLRALAAFYVRLTSERSEDVYTRLEGFLSDYRKLRTRGNAGWGVTTIDEFVDDLIQKDRVCATSFWKLVGRGQLEDEEKLEERVSPLQHLLDAEEEDDDREGGRDSESDEANGQARRAERDGKTPNPHYLLDRSDEDTKQYGALHTNGEIEDG